MGSRGGGGVGVGAFDGMVRGGKWKVGNVVDLEG